MAVIIVVKEKGYDPFEVFIKGKVYFGTSKDGNDIVLHDHLVSRKHCTFELSEKGELIIQDLGSKNGCYVGNSLINYKSLVKVGDIVCIGSTIIMINQDKLTARERIAIGTKITRKHEEKTLPPWPVSSSDGES